MSIFGKVPRRTGGAVHDARETPIRTFRGYQNHILFLFARQRTGRGVFRCRGEFVLGFGPRIHVVFGAGSHASSYVSWRVSLGRRTRVMTMTSVNTASSRVKRESRRRRRYHSPRRREWWETTTRTRTRRRRGVEHRDAASRTPRREHARAATCAGHKRVAPQRHPKKSTSVNIADTTFYRNLEIRTEGTRTLAARYARSGSVPGARCTAVNERPWTNQGCARVGFVVAVTRVVAGSVGPRSTIPSLFLAQGAVLPTD